MPAEILIIDDNSDIRQLISGILRDQDFKVREAANFDQALLEIKLFKFIFLKTGFGILAKSENSFNKCSISLICLVIVSK